MSRRSNVTSKSYVLHIERNVFRTVCGRRALDVNCTREPWREPSSALCQQCELFAAPVLRQEAKR